VQPAVSLQPAQRARTRRFAFGGVRFALPPLLALLLAVLAYQVPAATRIDVGALGDQLFLPSSEAQREQQIAGGAWYADQIDSAGGRSRWSRERAVLQLPGLGAGQDLRLTLELAGWPADVLRAEPKQPQVQLLVGGRELARLRPSPEVAPFSFDVPAELRSGAGLEATLLVTPTFTDTAAYADARPKGIRLDAVTVVPLGWGALPDWGVVLGLALAATLAMLAVPRSAWRVPGAILAGLLVAVLGAAGLVGARAWLAAALPALLGLLALAAAIARWASLYAVGRWIGQRLARGRALDYGLLAALLVFAVALLLRALAAVPILELPAPLQRFAGTDLSSMVWQLLWLLAVAGGTAVAVTAGVTAVPRRVLRLRGALLITRLAPALLLLAALVWFAYLFWLIWSVPVVGHADYADNAVVARNLLRGRGWVVDYVTQFYWLEPNGVVTRPQETWPLLQPLLMLPAMWLLGPTPFAARLINLPLLAAVIVLVYAAGARYWDRRAGLLAALLVLVNLWIFRLVLYSTSDLALVVWSFAAFWLAFEGIERLGRSKLGTREAGERQGRSRVPAKRVSVKVAGRRLEGWKVGRLVRNLSTFQPFNLPTRSLLLASGFFIGLMVLQKPSSAIMAVGLGIWALWRLEAKRRAIAVPWRQAVRWLLPIAAWTGVALLVVSPYLVRNLAEFGRPFFSTEAWDAWIIYFRGSSEDAWDDIYKVYATELGGPGTPDRSWILRWGWDLTLNKIAQQARDALTFFAPPKGALLNYDVDGVALSWLMLAGMLALHGRQRRLVGMLLAALLPYTAFLIVYWHTHYEQRYFVAFVPWLALLAAAGSCRIFDRLASIGNGRWAGLAGLALLIALGTGIAPHWREIDAVLTPSNPKYYGRLWDRSLLAWEWLRENTPAGTVIMTRVPWQLNYYADRPALMTPDAKLETIHEIARYYNAQYIVTNSISTSAAERGVLRPLTQGQELPGFRLVKEIPDPYPGGASVYVYRIENDER